MKNHLILLIFLLVTPLVQADINEGDMRLGATAGHVGLLSEVGDRSGNSLGFGAIANYTVTSEMQFELGYLGSSHNRLRHSQISAGINLYFNSYDAAYFAALMGVDFIGHELEGVNSSGMALYGGLGVDFELNKNFGAGLFGKYHYAFETSVNINNQSVKAIQSFVTVLVRLMFIIPNS